jgi:hypothetical protein
LFSCTPVCQLLHNKQHWSLQTNQTVAAKPARRYLLLLLLLFSCCCCSVTHGGQQHTSSTQHGPAGILKLSLHHPAQIKQQTTRIYV